MSHQILIVGATGTGKSTSIENLNKDRLCVLNTENKPMPFRNSKRIKYLASIKTTETLIRAIDKIEANDDVDVVIIDSISMHAEIACKREIVDTATDYRKAWGVFQNHLVDIILKAKESKKHYVFIAHEAIIQDNEENMIFVAKIPGGLRGNLESHFSYVFRAMTIDDIDSENGIKYVFATNKTPRLNISAKSPRGMFDSLYIDNDINYVIDMIDKYENE